MPRKIDALIIDDSPTTRRMIMAALHQAGLADFTFAEAGDGLEALKRFRPDDTEIIFVDMNMPRMGGLEFIRELRARHPRCPPTVVITAESNKDRLRQAFKEPGVSAFLLKPVDQDRLRSGLKRIVDSIPERSGPYAVPHGECVPRAVTEVLHEACGLRVTHAPSEQDVMHGDLVLGMLVIQGAVHWSVALGFARETAEAVVSGFAGYEIPFDHADMGDAIGEITNMVGGRLKALLGARGVNVEMSLPAVVGASNFRILRLRNTPADSTEFDAPAGKLWSTVAVGLHGGMVL